MDRRAFIGTLAGGLLVAPLTAEAQQPTKVPWKTEKMMRMRRHAAVSDTTLRAAAGAGGEAAPWQRAKT